MPQIHLLIHRLWPRQSAGAGFIGSVCVGCMCLVGTWLAGLAAAEAPAADQGAASGLARLFLPGEITTSSKCSSFVEPLRKLDAGRVVRPDRAWESDVGYPCVHFDEKTGTWRMWYLATREVASRRDPSKPLVDGVAAQYEMNICYAESKNGLDWVKPAINRLKAVQYPGNNIVVADSGFIGGQATVIHDADDPDPARRYKLFVYDNDGKGRDGARTAVSPDGLDWTFIGEFPVLPSQDTPSLWHDRLRGRYVAFLKARLDNRRGRLVSVSPDFLTWSEPEPLLAAGPADPQTVHFYCQQAFRHWGHDLGLLTRYDTATEKADVQLITAADGLAWRRLPVEPPILEPGAAGQWDSGGVYTGTGDPIVVAGMCRLYYSGGNVDHAGRLDPEAKGRKEQGIGAMEFVPGRLAGQQFGGDGWFQTLPFRCPGGRLEINAACAEPVAVEVHSTGYGGPIGGFTRDECVAIRGDDPRHAIAWKQHATLDPLRGKFIELRLYGRAGRVYGMRIVPHDSQH